MKSNIINALKEVGRLVVFAIPGIAIQVVTDNPELSVAYGGIVLVVLRAIDKAIHEDKNIKARGLLPF